MPKRHIGLVVGKDFRPLPGGTSGDRCYLTVDLSEDERISVRVGNDKAAIIDVGDVVQFRKPRSVHRPVRRMTRLGSDPALLP